MTDDLLNAIDQPDDGDLLEDLDDTDAPMWRPEPGEGVQGVVVSRHQVPSKYDGQPPTEVVVLRLADSSQVAIFGSRSRSRAEIVDKDPQVGDTFAMKYFGAKPKAKGEGEFHQYKAAVRRGERPPVAPVAASRAPF